MLPARRVAANPAPTASLADYPAPAGPFVRSAPAGRLHDAATCGERILNGLWSAGFSGQVVGVLIDAGTGTTEAEIRSALTVTLLDPVMYPQVTDAVTAHVWCEIDRIDDPLPE